MPAWNSACAVSRPPRPTRKVRALDSLDLVRRVTAYFERHIAFFEEVLAGLGRIEENLAGEDFERLLSQQARDDERSAHLLRERRGLLREWLHDTGLTDADRQAVRVLSDRFDVLAGQVRERYGEVMDLVQQELTDRRDIYHTLRRGRGLLNTYRPGGGDQGAFIDKKA